MTASLTKTTADIASIPDVTATTLRLDTQSKDSGVDTLKPGADPDSGNGHGQANTNVDPAANGTDGTDETDRPTMGRRRRRPTWTRPTRPTSRRTATRPSPAR